MKLYVSHHAPAHVVSNGSIVPVQVGAAMAKCKLSMQGDNTGDHISELNQSYCELTAQYWVWKNAPPSGYVGFMHYRRFFDFLPDRSRSLQPWGESEINRFDETFIEDFGLEQGHMTSVCDGYDVIIPKGYDVRHSGAATLQEHYAKSPHHNAADYLQLDDLLETRFPEWHASFRAVSRQPVLIPANMFIMRWSLFEEYSQWLFSVLEELRQRIDVSTYDKKQKRVFGFLAERLFTTYIHKKRHDSSSCQIREINRVFVKNTAARPMALPPPKTRLPVVSIATACDRNYLPHLGACLSSLLTEASPKHFIDIVVMADGLGEIDQTMLRVLEARHPACRISFVDMSAEYLDVETHYKITRTTYYRLSLPEIMPDRDKVLYLDPDTVVMADVSGLFNTPLGIHLAVVTRELRMAALVSLKVKAHHLAGGLEAGRYLSEYVGLGHSMGQYFQAGVMLLNLEKLRSERVSEHMQKDIRTRFFWLMDQDVLNKNLHGRVKFADAAWNAIAVDETEFDVLSLRDQETYLSSMESPKIVHYAGPEKPWTNSTHRWRHLYWQHLRSTPWYEDVLASYTQYNHSTQSSPSSFKKALTGLWERFPPRLRHTLMPVADFIDRLIK